MIPSNRLMRIDLGIFVILLIIKAMLLLNLSLMDLKRNIYRGGGNRGRYLARTSSYAP